MEKKYTVNEGAVVRIDGYVSRKAASMAVLPILTTADAIQDYFCTLHTQPMAMISTCGSITKPLAFEYGRSA